MACRRVVLGAVLLIGCATQHQEVQALLVPQRTKSLQQKPLTATTTTTRRRVNESSEPRHLAPFQESPLFASSKTSSSLHNEKRKRLPFLQKTLRKLLLTTLPAFLLASSPAWAAAGTTTTTMMSSTTTIRQFMKSVPWKRVVQTVLSLWGLSLVVSNLMLKRRQADNATSEWSRYAQKPAARGRAIVWLMMQQAMIILSAQIMVVRRSTIRTYAGKHFANGLLMLGPLYIKMGQIVSCRKNLLGPEWITAMQRLQDQVPAREGQEAMDLAYSTLEGGKEEFDTIFKDFSATPLAAASLGQVHKATLRVSGDVVAVKVQRPNLRQIYDQDLEFLTTIAQWMDKLPGTSKNVGGVSSSWTKIFNDAEDILYREIDYRDEASNAIRFAQDFGLTLGGNAMKATAKGRNQKNLPSAADWIRTPYVYQELSNERLLIMEYLPSIKITNTAKLDAANITSSDRIDLADSLARAYLRQFCCNLFFSTDPHPGNLGVEVMPNGKPRLVIYDFGQAATLNQDQADGILGIIEAIIDMDVERSIEAFKIMGVLVDGADLDKVRAKVGENYRTGKVKANRKKLKRKGYRFKEEETTTTNNATASSATTSADDIDATTNETAKNAEVMSFFSLPAEYAFVARAISQMDGVGKSLDPDFDFISNSAPYIVEIKGADKYLTEEVIKSFSNLQSKIAKFQMRTVPDAFENIKSTS